MPSNPYINYYVNQAGSGIGGFQGQRFQRGHGWLMKTLWKSALLPLLRYMAPKAISTGADIALDTLKGDNVIDSIKKRGKLTAKHIAQDAGDRAMKFVQTGSGRRRRYRKRKNTKSTVTKKHYKRRRRTRRSRRVANNIGATSIFG